MRTDQQPIRLTLVAPKGRMGIAIGIAALADGRFTIDQDRGDVLVDFSVPAALPATLERARTAGVPVLIGTTGLDELADERIEAASREIAILRASNTAIGVALLEDLVERAARVLGLQWDIEIVEMHHQHKADAPSGTALTLGEAAARGRNSPLVAERGRNGTGLRRQDGAVGFAALRGGTVVGDHDVIFAGSEERLILSHRAESRAIFARGALAAAAFLHGRPAGLYSMRDVIEQA